MPSINAIVEFTGFDRGGISRRVKRFELETPISCKDIFDLKPLDQKHKNKLSLEEARTDLAVEDTRLKRLQAEKIEGQLADVDQLMEAENQLLEGISSIIKSSQLEQDKKDDIYTQIRDHGRKWKEGFSK
jgi:tRNA splicing endonuclease